MNITLLPSQEKFIFEYDGVEQEVTFNEIKNSDSWKEHKLITITHLAVNEHGIHPVTTLNRTSFLDNMKHADEEYMRYYNLWDINTTIHKLYSLLDGKSEDVIDTEIENVSEQRKQLDQAKRDWNNSQVEKYAALEEALPLAETDIDREKIEKKMQKIKSQKPPFLVSQEMKKLYFAARDKSKPEITLANVDQEKAAYCDELKII